MRAVIRLRHLAHATEQAYCGWLKRFAGFVAERCQPDWKPAQKMEAFLTQLAQQDVSASTQNGAFNAILFFYREVLKQDVGKVDSLRAKKPVHLRYAPEQSEVLALLKNLKDDSDYPTTLIVKLIYGCGLRVTEPLNLRVKDVLDTHKFSPHNMRHEIQLKRATVWKNVRREIRHLFKSRTNAMDLPVRVRHDEKCDDSKSCEGPCSELWAWNLPSKYTARRAHEQNAGICCVGLHQAAVLQSAVQELPSVGRAWNKNVRTMESRFHAFPGGCWTPTIGSPFFRQEEQRRELRTRKRAVGNSNCAAKQQADESNNRSERRISFHRSMGKTNRNQSWKSCEAIGFWMVGRESSFNATKTPLNEGQNPRAIQQAMGHSNLETTMGYLHAESMNVKSPLDFGRNLRPFQMPTQITFDN